MEEINILRIVLSFALVLGLIGIMAAGLRWWIRKNPSWISAGKAEGRLQIVESRMLDARRRLALIKCDEQEYLLLLAPDREMVIEKITSKITTKNYY